MTAPFHLSVTLLVATPLVASAEPCADYLKRQRVRGHLVLYAKAQKRLCYFEGGKLRFSAKASYGSAEGKKRFVGDKRTPEGRYTLAPARRSKKYGLFMHVSYPNAADRAYAKRHGRPPGSAIGVHGPPRGFVFLGPLVTWFNASDGCIMLKERDIRRFAALLRRPVPMVITPR